MILDGFELPTSSIHPLVKSVYESSDAFCASFEEMYPTEREMENHFADLRSRQGSLFLVAEEQSKLVGYLFLEPRAQSKLRHTADLSMGVSPEARGKGIGRSLLDAALRQANQGGVLEIVYLMVRADNRQAVRLYDSLGFEKLSVLYRDTKIGSEYFDGLLMRKFIADSAS